MIWALNRLKIPVQKNSIVSNLHIRRRPYLFPLIINDGVQRKFDWNVKIREKFKKPSIPYRRSRKVEHASFVKRVQLFNSFKDFPIHCDPEAKTALLIRVVRALKKCKSKILRSKDREFSPSEEFDTIRQMQQCYYKEKNLQSSSCECSSEWV